MTLQEIVTGDSNCNSCNVYFSTKYSFWCIHWFESHQQKLPQHQDDETSNSGHDLEGGHYLGVSDVVHGVKDDQVAGVGDGHEAEGDEGGEPDQLDCKVNQDHHCQGQLTKYHPEQQRVFWVAGGLGDRDWGESKQGQLISGRTTHLRITGKMRVHVWSSSNLKKKLKWKSD